MNAIDIFWIILGMAVVTYVPRVIPAFVLDRLSLSPSLKRWLDSIPHAALGALIFPGVLTIHPEPHVGLIGAFVSALLAYFRLPILLVIAGGILAVWCVNAFGV